MAESSLPVADWGDDIVASHGATFLHRMVRALPKTVDDIERDFGLATYLKIQNDPVAGPAIDFLKDLVLSEGMQIQPRFKLGETPTAEETANAAKAEEMQKFIEWCIRNHETPIEHTLEGLLDCVAFGYSVAETNFEIATDGPYRGKIVPTDLSVKPRENCLFVVNPSNRVLGFLVYKVGQIIPPFESGQDPLTDDHFVPHGKFVWISNRMLFGDPRGRSDLRRAYSDWEFKNRAKVEWFKHLMLHGSGKLIALLKIDGVDKSQLTSYDVSSDGTIKLDGNGNRVEIARVTAITNALVASKNASVGAIEADELVQVEAKSHGEAFVAAEQCANTNITTAILGASRATREAQHGSKADGEVALDVIAAKVRRIKNHTSLALDERYVKPLIEVNFGRDMLEFRPIVSLGAFRFKSLTEAAQFAKTLENFVDETQKPFIDEMIGIEKRDLEAIEFRDAQRREEDRLAMQQEAAIQGPKDQNPSQQT